MGPIEFRVPQARDGVAFYPSSLEKGIRSEKALKLDMAERYIQGASTRKVTKIVEELCGHSVSSTQVSQCAAKLDVELDSWRQRPLGACSYLILDAWGWLPISVPSSTLLIFWPQTLASKNSLPLISNPLQNSLPGWKKTCPKALPSLPCRLFIRSACAPATPSNALTGKSIEELTSPLSSLTSFLSCA